LFPILSIITRSCKKCIVWYDEREGNKLKTKNTSFSYSIIKENIDFGLNNCKPLFQCYKVLGLAFSEAQGQPYSRTPIPYSVYSFCSGLSYRSSSLLPLKSPAKCSARAQLSFIFELAGPSHLQPSALAPGADVLPSCESIVF